VVTIGAAQCQCDASLAAALASYGELAGMPVDTPWTKRYAVGMLPVGDAFLTWSQTARPGVANAPTPPPVRVPGWWRAPLSSVLVVLGATPWLPALARRCRRPRAEHERLVAAGVTVTREPRPEPWGLVEMWIEDPDGVRIVLVEVPADHPLRRDPR
jgi:hypothetical protein